MEVWTQSHRPPYIPLCEELEDKKGGVPFTITYAKTPIIQNTVRVEIPGPRQ